MTPFLYAHTILKNHRRPENGHAVVDKFDDIFVFVICMFHQLVIWSDLGSTQVIPGLTPLVT